LTFLQAGFDWMRPQDFFPWVIEHPPEAGLLPFVMVSVIAFAVVVWFVLKMVPGPMIRGILDERKTAIAHAADQVQSTLRETEHMRNDYRVRLEGIHQETERRLAEAVHEAESLREAILEDARKAAAAIVQRGHQEVERERAKTVKTMRTEFIDDVIQAAQYAAASSLDSNAHQRLVREFVQEVGAKS
jgi:F-type H+-transporting ATPase subunit b